MFKFGETVIRTIVDRSTEEDEVLGTERVEVISIDAVPGVVVVRPHNGEDFVRVKMVDLNKDDGRAVGFGIGVS